MIEYCVMHIFNTLINKIGKDKFDKYEKYDIWQFSDHMLFDDDEEVRQLVLEDSLNE